MATIKDRYAIVGVQPIDYAGESWFVNMDELKKAGVEKAPETVDELLEAMRAVKEKDSAVTPFLSYWNISYAMGAFANLINAQTSAVYYDTEDDTYKFAYNEESSKRKELIQLMADMYSARFASCVPSLLTAALSLNVCYTLSRVSVG